MRIAGVLHDIGKLAVADAILHKPGALTDDEWARGAPPLRGRRPDPHATPACGDVAAWVLAHHERWAGGGYPHGIAGEAIPLEARILAVADAYEAMTAVRPYRPHAARRRRPPARSSRRGAGHAVRPGRGRARSSRGCSSGVELA